MPAGIEIIKGVKALTLTTALIINYPNKFDHSVENNARVTALFVYILPLMAINFQILIGKSLRCNLFQSEV
jgi:hypothetical protein